MALATQCPHCHTTFKVAHDQLKLRSGLVRCGACKQIFNGIENLVAPEQTSSGTPPSVPDKQLPVPAGASPAVSSTSSSIPAVPPTPAAPAPAPPAPADEIRQSAPRMPQVSEHSAINNLEFVPVDDPETQTRILAPASPPDQTPAQEQAPAIEPQPVDEDPLTRMTLVDFSMFDEDIAKTAATPEPAAITPEADSSAQDIWPNTREQVESEADFETTMPGKPDATDIAHPEPVPIPEALHETKPQPLPAMEVSTSNETEPDSRVDATTIGMAETTLGHDVHTLASAEAEPAVSTGTSATVIEEQEYGESEIAAASAAEEDEEPSFVTGERRRQRRRRVMRIFMAIASILLLAAVLFQAAYVFRNQLAVRFPQTKPLLAQLCDVAGCQVLLPSQIDQVSIESNELQMAAANKNVFTLNLLLHNRSSVPQAWPHIELTLNDKDGKALVRRVLTPKEYLPADKKLAEGIAARSEQAINVSFELNQLQASDYRVYLFYP